MSEQFVCTSFEVVKIEFPTCRQSLTFPSNSQNTQTWVNCPHNGLVCRYLGVQVWHITYLHTLICLPQHFPQQTFYLSIYWPCVYDSTSSCWCVCSSSIFISPERVDLLHKHSPTPLCFTYINILVSERWLRLQSCFSRAPFLPHWQCKSQSHSISIIYNLPPCTLTSLWG